MTEKRFKMDNESDIIEFDYNSNEYIQDFMWADGKSWDRICNRLNELYEENEQLQSELGEKDIQLDFLKAENKHMSNLVNENKWLKSELKALRKKYNDFSDMVDKRLKEMDRELVK